MFIQVRKNRTKNGKVSKFYRTRPLKVKLIEVSLENKVFHKLSNWFDSPTTTTVRCVSFIIETVRGIHMQQKQRSIPLHFLAERISVRFFSFFALLNVKRVVCGISLLRNSLTKLLCVRFVFITGKRAGYSHEYNSHVYVCLCVCTLKRSWCTAQKLNWIGYSKMEHTHTHKHAKLFFFILMKTTSSWIRSDTQKV